MYGETESGFHEEVWRPSDLKDIRRLIDGLSTRLETILRANGFELVELRVRTLLEESILNGWVHGNNCDPTARLTIGWRINDEFQLEVKDQGPGFDPATVPDPTTSENITRTSGRGIFIMKYFADGVRWEEGGTKLVATLAKHRSFKD
jgi:serine/threonine-protein kinase RsbW